MGSAEANYNLRHTGISFTLAYVARLRATHGETKYTTSDVLLHVGRTAPLAFGDTVVAERDCTL